MTEQRDPQETLKELQDAVKDALRQSLPYIAKHGAFLMPYDCWDTLAALVDPRIALFDELLKRRDRGETLTLEEIEAAVGFDPTEG